MADGGAPLVAAGAAAPPQPAPRAKPQRVRVELAVAGRVQLGGEVGAQGRERAPARNAASRCRPARRRGIRPALVRLLARDRVAAQLLRHSGGRRRGLPQKLERLAVLVQRPAVPANVAGAYEPEPVAAEVALELVLVGVVGELAERREV